MSIGLTSGRGIAVASILFLFAAGAAPSAADSDGPADLLDVLLENGSITQEQYDSLKTDVPVPDPAASRSTETQDEAPAPSASTGVDDTAEDPADARIEAVVDRVIAEDFPVKISYGSKGFRLESRDGNWQTNLQWRFQFRLTHPFLGDPRQLDDFDEDNQRTSFQARRLRMKIGGHGYRPWLKYYFEVDLQPLRDPDDSAATASTRVIDWRVDVAKWEKLGLRVGQWKIDFNRERVDSSGRQQFVERSIVNRIFTIDRQMGVQLRGRLFKGTPGDIRYYAGVFNGEGRGLNNLNNKMMGAGRLQWNFLGRDLALRQTDVERHEKPAASLSVGGAHTVGVCTRWSSSGCGNLDGFTAPSVAVANGDNNQFEINQAQQGFAFKWQGFSAQQEFHWKRVEDRVNVTENDLYGAYGTGGILLQRMLGRLPRAARVRVPLRLAEGAERDRPVDRQRAPGVHARCELVLRRPQQQADLRLLVPDVERQPRLAHGQRPPRALPVGHLVLGASSEPEAGARRLQ